MSSNLKVNTIQPSSGDTVSIAGIASVTSSVSIASSCTATTFYGSGANLTGISAGLSNIVEDTSPQLGGNLDCNNKNISLNDSSSGANNRIKIGTHDDLHLWHNSGTGNSNISNYNGDLYIQGNNGSGTGVNAIRIQSNGAVELNYQGGQKFTTTNTGVQINGKLDFNGSGHLNGVNLGASQQLNLYHDTNDAYFDNNVGDFYIRNDGNSTSEVLRFQAKGNQNSIICTPNGSVDLHFSGTKKFETVTGGVQVTGAYELEAASGQPNPTIDNADGGQKRSLYFKTGATARLIIQDDGHTRPASNNTFDLGTTSDRWRNIYTNDLNLSNKGSTNSVDNTWGDYTIQEGESDLFLINNRNGKKYKFNLTEVS